MLTAHVHRQREIENVRWERATAVDELLMFIRSFVHDLRLDIAAEARGVVSVDGWQARFRADGTFMGLAYNL
jgi:hypothetical protein